METVPKADKLAKKGSWKEQEHAHPTIMAAAKLLRCSACEESKPKLSRPVTSDRVTAPAEYVGFDGFHWIVHVMWRTGWTGQMINFIHFNVKRINYVMVN